MASLDFIQVLFEFHFQIKPVIVTTGHNSVICKTDVWIGYYSGFDGTGKDVTYKWEISVILIYILRSFERLRFEFVYALYIGIVVNLLVKYLKNVFPNWYCNQRLWKNIKFQ